MLRFNNPAMGAATEGWEDVVLLVLPGVAGLGAVVSVVEGLTAVLKRRREMRGRSEPPVRTVCTAR